MGERNHPVMFSTDGSLVIANGEINPALASNCQPGSGLYGRPYGYVIGNPIIPIEVIQKAAMKQLDKIINPDGEPIDEDGNPLLLVTGAEMDRRAPLYPVSTAMTLQANGLYKVRRDLKLQQMTNSKGASIAHIAKGMGVLGTLAADENGEQVLEAQTANVELFAEGPARELFITLFGKNANVEIRGRAITWVEARTASSAVPKEARQAHEELVLGFYDLG